MPQRQPGSLEENEKGARIIAAGVPRSGSTLIYQVICALFPDAAVTKTHKFTEEADAKIVVTYRDFRDVTVSMARAMRSRNGQPFKWGKLDEADRSKDSPMRIQGHEKITREELEITLENALSKIEALDSYRGLALASDRVLLMRYELFFSDYDYIFQQLSGFFGINIDRATRREIVEITSIKRNQERAAQLQDFSHYDPKSQIHGAHIYDGKVGGWVRFIDPKDRNLLLESLGDALARYGYVPTEGQTGLMQS
ncbi:MAG: sulfotransferase domain-containing protein [Geitlerinemataceae cyanobacterium]